MARFSKVSKIKAKRKKAISSRIATIIYNQSLMRDWAGKATARIHARAKSDATGLIHLITNVVPTLTYHVVFDALLETAAQDLFYDVETRLLARKLQSKRRDRANWSF